MAKPHTFTLVQREAIRARLQRFIDAAGSQRQAAQALGVSNMAVSKAAESIKGVGPGVAAALERETGEHVEDWVRGMQQPTTRRTSTEPTTGDRVAVLEERYPVMAEEFAAAVAIGVLSERDIVAARALVGQFKSDEGPTREQVRQAIARARKTIDSARECYREALELDDEVSHG